MQVLIWLIPLSLTLSFVWAVLYIVLVRNGQFDDLEQRSVEILFDDVEMEQDSPDT